MAVATKEKVNVGQLTQKQQELMIAARNIRHFSLNTTLVGRSGTAFGRGWPPHRPLSVTAVTRPSADLSPRGEVVKTKSPRRTDRASRRS